MTKFGSLKFHINSSERVGVVPTSPSVLIRLRIGSSDPSGWRQFVVVVRLFRSQKPGMTQRRRDLRGITGRFPPATPEQRAAAPRKPKNN